MDEQQARQRLLEGGYFVALGVPPGVEFGIDLKSYTTGAQFKGVKMIPPGLHFAHFGTGEGEKQGIFFRSSAGSVAATQWDAAAEDLVDAQTYLPEGALRALRESVLRLEMDASLGPHPFEQLAAWLNLTNCITDSVLERCGVPVGAKVLAGSSAAEPGEPGAETADVDVGAAVGESGTEESKGNGGKRGRGRAGGGAGGRGGGGAAGSGREIVPHFPHIGRVARYCDVPGYVGKASANPKSKAAPEEVTKQNMDGSELLRRWIASDFSGSWMELLGELQLSFVLFVSLSSLGGFRHWQALSALLCRCGDALKTDPALFTAFIRMLHGHLKLVPEDFFDVELSKDNFLVPCLSALLQNVLPDESLAPTLLDAGKRLLKFLQQRFGLFPSRSGGGARHGPSAAAGVDGDGDGDAMVDDDGDADGDGRGPGEGEDEDEASAVSGSLSLMQLELSEEDQPAVVPYEEVVRALGDGALGLNGSMQQQQQQQQQEESGTSSRPRGDKHKHKQEWSASAVAAPAPRAVEATESSVMLGQHQGHGQGQREGGQEGGTAGAATGDGNVDGEEARGGPNSIPGVNGGGVQVLSAPSLEHSRRWRDIDRLLVAAAPASNSSTSSPSPLLPEARGGGGQGSMTLPTSGVGSRTCGRAVSSPVARASASTAAVTAVAKRYPLLFAATRPNEDVMMAAARLVASQEEEEGGGTSSGAVVQEAVAFLEEEVAASEDGGASVWQVSRDTGRQVF